MTRIASSFSERWGQLRSALRWLRGYLADHIERWPEMIMAICTIAIAYYAFIQSDITSQQAQISDRQTRILEFQQRAYVTIAKIEPIDPAKIQGGSLVPTEMTITNAGHNPAIGLQIKTDFAQGLPGQPVKRTYREAESPTSVISIGAASNVFTSSVLQVPLTGEQAKAIRSGDLLLYFYGELTYGDAFQARYPPMTFLAQWSRFTGRWVILELEEGNDKRQQAKTAD